MSNDIRQEIEVHDSLSMGLIVDFTCIVYCKRYRLTPTDNNYVDGALLWQTLVRSVAAKIDVLYGYADKSESVLSLLGSVNSFSHFGLQFWHE